LFTTAKKIIVNAFSPKLLKKPCTEWKSKKLQSDDPTAETEAP
jgi:hypothetical protein